MPSRVRPALALALIATGACKPEPEVVHHTETKTLTNTNTNTVVVTEPNTAITPGRYTSPLVQLAKVYGDDGAVGSNGAMEDHMHVDEVKYRDSDTRFFYCSYTFGVVDVSDPGDPEYLAQGYEWDLPSPVDRATGCLHLDWDDADPDIIYVSHRGNYDFHPHLSVVDLNTSYDPYDVYLDDPFYAPILATPLTEDGVSYEGLDAENGYVYVALHAGGVGVFQRDALTNEMSRVGGNDSLIGNAYDIEVVGNLAYVVDEQQGLYVLDVTDPNGITQVSHLFTGGVVRDLAVDEATNTVWLAGGGAGLVGVDVSDPANPTLIGFTPTSGTAVRVAHDGTRVAVAAWNDTRVFDVANPAAPTLIGAARLETSKDYADDPGNERPDITARTLGVDLSGDNLFVGNWWVPYTYQIHADRQAPYMVLPEDIFYMGIGTVAIGSTGTYAFTVRNDGNAPLVITDAWATDPAFVITPSTVEIPAGGSQDLTITYTASSVDETTAIVNLATDDPAQPLRKGYAVANAVGVGVGDPFPYTEATDVNTLAAWDSSVMSGQVGLVAYFATF